MVQRHVFSVWHLARANYNVIFGKTLSIPACFSIYFKICYRRFIRIIGLLPTGKKPCGHTIKSQFNAELAFYNTTLILQ